MPAYRTLYVDSSYAEVDDSGGRFKLNLTDGVIIPAGSRAYVDDCIFPYSWQSVMSGENDRAFLVTQIRDGVFWSGYWRFNDPNIAPSQQDLAGDWSTGGKNWSIEERSLIDGKPDLAGTWTLTGGSHGGTDARHGRLVRENRNDAGRERVDDEWHRIHSEYGGQRGGPPDVDGDGPLL